MSEMQSWHQDFADALVGESRDAPSRLFGGTPERVAAGWRVYRNNVAHSLAEVLRDSFPTVDTLVGSDFFRQAAHEFQKQAMPVSAMVWEYGHGFADFLDHYPEAGSLPWLGDVARLEFGRWQSYHGPAEDALTPEHLQAIPPERFSDARFKLKTSLSVMSSDYPAVSIWMEHQEDSPDFSAINLDVGERGMTYRQSGSVYTRKIEPSLAQFLTALQGGEVLACAAQQAMEVCGDPDLGGGAFSLEGALALLVSSELITDVVTDAITDAMEKGMEE